MKDIKNDALYVGTDHGLWAYDYQKSEFRDWLKGSPNGVRSIVEDGDHLWLGTSTGLYKYHLKTHVFEKYGNGKLGNEIIYALLKASDGNIYIGTYNGLYYYDQQRGYFRSISLPLLPGKSNVFVNALIEDPSRKCIWIGTGGRLYRYGLTTNQMDYVQALDKNSIKSFAIDNADNLLIGTDNGLYVYQDKKEVRHIQHDSRQSSHSLINDVVWCLYNDVDGNVWLGTDEGISVSQKKREIEFIPISSFTGRGTGNHFYHILGDKKNGLWLGGSDGLIHTSPSLQSNSTWFSVDNLDASISHNRIRKIYEDKDGDLWICTDGGIHFWKGTYWQHINLGYNPTKRNANWAYDIIEDNQKRMWVASFMGGLMVIDKQKLVISEHDCQADQNIFLPGGKGLSPFRMVEDKDNNMWVLYYNDGLWQINPKTGSATKNNNVEKEIGDEIPNSIYTDSKHRIWIGLTGRVLCVDDSVKSYRLGYEKKSDVSWITEVNNDVWIGTQTGIWVISKQGVVHKKHIANADAAYYDSTSRLLYLGSVDGVYVGRPEEMRNTFSTHPILLTGVWVDNQLVGQNNTNGLSFSPNQRHIAFTVSDLPYTNGEKSEFLYRLAGIDEDWIAIPQNDNRISFNNLNYGSYTLEISKLGLSGEPTDIIVIPFTIRHPWYLRWWSITLYIIMCIGFIGWSFMFYRMRNRLRYEQMEKEHILEQLRLKMEIHPDLKQAAEIAEPQPIIAANAISMSAADEKFLKEVTDTIDAHLSDSDLNVQSLCDYIGMGNKLVYRRLKQLTGKTPVEYIRSIRLNKAAVLLKQKKFTISEVMYLSGFSNASYFSKCFLAEYGCSPRDYIEKV
jgi:ligand-binding sensor domain-containing protein/AraC-like DNA-binding protein